MDMIIQGLIAAATVLYLFSYFDVRKVLNYAFIIDIVVTGGFIYMFAGSYAGMMTGVIAGLIVSGVLRIARTLMGVKSPRLVRRAGALIPTIVWTRSKS